MRNNSRIGKSSSVSSVMNDVSGGRSPILLRRSGSRTKEKLARTLFACALLAVLCSGLASADVIGLSSTLALGDSGGNCGYYPYQTSELFQFELPDDAIRVTVVFEATDVEFTNSVVEVNGSSIGSMPITGSGCDLWTEFRVDVSDVVATGSNDLFLQTGINGSNWDDIDLRDIEVTYARAVQLSPGFALGDGGGNCTLSPDGHSKGFLFDLPEDVVNAYLYFEGTDVEFENSVIEVNGQPFGPMPISGRGCNLWTPSMTDISSVVADGTNLVFLQTGLHGTNWDEIELRGVEVIFNLATPTSAPPERIWAGLSQNTPNPFNPSTSISFELSRDGEVCLQVFDMRGVLVRTLLDERRSGGRHATTWDGRDGRGRHLPSGVYMYRLETAGGTAMRTMTLLK